MESTLFERLSRYEHAEGIYAFGYGYLNSLLQAYHERGTTEADLRREWYQLHCAVKAALQALQDNQIASVKEADVRARIRLSVAARHGQNHDFRDQRASREELKEQAAVIES